MAVCFNSDTNLSSESDAWTCFWHVQSVNYNVAKEKIKLEQEMCIRENYIDINNTMFQHLEGRS